MPNVIDAHRQGRARSRATRIFNDDFSGKRASSIARFIASLPTRAPVRLRRSKRDEVAAAAASRGAKGTGRARQGSIRSPQWRHGGVVFGPQPRSYVEVLNKKERRLAFIAALADRFKTAPMTLLDASDFAIDEDRRVRQAALRQREGRARRPATLIVCGRDENAGATDRAREPQPARVGVTHDGRARRQRRSALRPHRLHDRRAYEALNRYRAERPRKRAIMDARDVIISPRITEKAMADASGQQYTFVVHPEATKTQIRHAIEEIFKVNVMKSTRSTCGEKRGTSRARGERRSGKQPATSRKPSSPSKPARKSSSAA